MVTRMKEHKGKRHEVSAAHPAADLFPWMDEAEIQNLADDIREKGQQFEVVQLPDGRLIDGRNRELACRVAGVEPKYRIEDLTDDEVIDRVYSANLRRRDINPSQRAMAAAALANMRQGERTDLAPSAPVQKVSRAQAAAKAGVSERSVNSAAKVQNKAPELVAAVMRGTLDVKTAAQVADLPKPDREAVAAADDPKAVARKALAAAKKGPLGDKPSATAPDAPARPDAAQHSGDVFAKELETVCRNLDATVSALLDLAPSRFAYAVHIDSAVAQIRAARATVWQGRPVHLCPYCAGADPECKVCQGTGRVKRSTLKAAPESEGGSSDEQYGTRGTAAA